MEAARQELAAVLREARSLLALPGNDFDWSSWADAGAALAEVDALVAALEAGRLPPRLAVSVLFAPTGPIQEVSLSSGWADQFLTLASRCDAAAEAATTRRGGAGSSTGVSVAPSPQRHPTPAAVSRHNGSARRAAAAGELRVRRHGAYRMVDRPVYEYKLLHGRADKVEAQLNELAAAGWEFVAAASGSGGMGSVLFFAFGAPVTIVLRRQRTDAGPSAVGRSSRE